MKFALREALSSPLADELVIPELFSSLEHQYEDERIFMCFMEQLSNKRKNL